MIQAPDRVMIDTMVHRYLRESEGYLHTLETLAVEVYTAVVQSNEIRDDIERSTRKKRSEIEWEIRRFDEIVRPEETSIDTSGWGELWGHNWGGSTGKVYEKLMRPDDNIGRIEQADAVGAEAAINRGMPFVTEDGDLKKRMRCYGYDEHLLPWIEFRELLDEQSASE